ncbi:hypothetical protein [Chelativorans salis]|uniref:DUF1127 domain-containing protein n=1 Tax=Chelativorans salis TaxID=2978478 RepID=A0ABT2LVR7_9HYPH|nr:hypothetical protein [Chelativorans sp. EGI FJ00035]MCT7378609.1 hypothetical protein [Chelativorans sp. EGI FJ00035]
MRARRFMVGIGEFFDTVGSAMAVSAAVRDRRPARADDLARLGIDPEQFRQISR